jgi:hypothetical protein
MGMLERAKVAYEEFMQFFKDMPMSEAQEKAF